MRDVKKTIRHSMDRKTFVILKPTFCIEKITKVGCFLLKYAMLEGITPQNAPYFFGEFYKFLREIL